MLWGADPVEPLPGRWSPNELPRVTLFHCDVSRKPPPVTRVHGPGDGWGVKVRFFPALRVQVSLAFLGSSCLGDEDLDVLRVFLRVVDPLLKEWLEDGA